MLRYTDVYPTETQPKKEKPQNKDSSNRDSLLSFCTVVSFILMVALANSWQPWVSHTSYNPATQEGCFTRGEKVICVYDRDADERPTREDETGYPESYPEFLR